VAVNAITNTTMKIVQVMPKYYSREAGFAISPNIIDGCVDEEAEQPSCPEAFQSGAILQGTDW